MKTKKFTLLVVMIIALTGGCTFLANAQADTGPGTGWGTLNPGYDLVLNEKFQGFAFYHSDSTSNMGNSNNVTDEVTGEVTYGYKNMDTTFTFLNSCQKVTYIFDTCAFAPNWKAAYAFRDTVDNVAGMSDGFVEISRRASGTSRGHFTVDLRNLEFVEAIQYSHSSCGGTKRGITVEFSIDNGETWDTLRYQPGNTYANSYSKDIFTGEKTSNVYNCQTSAYGMLWEDAVYSENLMLRFLESAGQVVRLHDLKVFGTPKECSAVEDYASKLAIRKAGNVVLFSKYVDVRVFNLSGVMVKTGKNTRELDLSDLNNGAYIVKALFDNQSASKKIIKSN